MNRKLPLVAATLCLLILLAPIASATAPAFGNTYASETPATVSVGFQDSTTLEVVTTRHFNVTADVNVTASLAAAAPTGYLVSFYFASGNSTFTKVLDHTNKTTESSNYKAKAGMMNALKAIVEIPQTHAKGIVTFDFVVMLNSTDAPAGNGGSLHPSFNHELQVIFYDPTTDTDADGLPDTWETHYFASLRWGRNDDPDGDGFTNAEELASCTTPANPSSDSYAGCTDPNDASSHPRQNVLGGAGGGIVQLSDDQVGILAGGFWLGALLAVGLVAAIYSNKKEVRAEHDVFLWGGAILLVLLVLFLFGFLTPMHTFAAWEQVNVPWQLWTIFALVSGFVLLAGAAVMIHVNKVAKTRRSGTERKFLVLGITVLAVAAVALALWMVYGLMHVALPWTAH